jgi:DNA-binding phage protein
MGHSICHDIEVLTVMRDRAQEAATRADEEWRERIRTAIAQGTAVSYIAESAGISRQRVYQIRDGKR